VLADDLRVLGTRPDYRHSAPKHIIELRKLIYFELTKVATNGENTRVIGAGYGAPRRPVAVVHRAELMHHERFAVAPNTAGSIEEGTRTAQPNTNRRQNEKGREKHKRKQREDDIKQAFCHSVLPVEPS